VNDSHDAVLRSIRREPDADEHDAIRELWKRHSIAEEQRDLAGLMATLTDDCVYELVQTGHRWEGHEGATRFYLGLLGAFPDIDFQLSGIVIGPQGVCEEADVTGTHEGEWLGIPPSGERLAWQVAIFFPWDAQQRLFRGERVYSAGLPLPA
jgi:predicted ester cyclase